MSRTFSHLIKYRLGLEPAQSQTTGAEREALAHHVAGCQAVAEIGVFEGLTSAVLARSMSTAGVFYCIDPFLPGRMGICWTRMIARHEVGKVRPGPRIVFLEKFSQDAAAVVREKLDFLFVDGDHSLAGIQRDWADWSGKLAPGGILALHDTQMLPNAPQSEALGSHRYFESHIRHDARFELLAPVDRINFMRRKSE